MATDDPVRAAFEAWCSRVGGFVVVNSLDAWRTFLDGYEAGAAAEREACAEIAKSHFGHDSEACAKVIHAAILARGEEEGRG